MVTNLERDLVFEIAQGNKQIIYFIGHMRMVCDDVKEMDYIQILQWLHRNNIKGQEFIGFMNHHCDKSVLQILSYIRKRILKDLECRSLYAKRL